MENCALKNTDADIHRAVSRAHRHMLMDIDTDDSAVFTLQTFAVCLVAGLLGVKRGVLAVIVFICLGAVGFPVFANFSGGLGVIFGTTGGYIIGLHIHI